MVISFSIRPFISEYIVARFNFFQILAFKSNRGTALVLAGDGNRTQLRVTGRTVVFNMKIFCYLNSAIRFSFTAKIPRSTQVDNKTWVQG